MQRKPVESMLLYSNRLLTLFKLAFPKKSYKASDTLITKFRQTIPRDFKSIIDNQVYSYKLRDELITWEIIKKCARIYDAEKEHIRRMKIWMKKKTW